ncbi:MAG: hypothetical protein WD063_03195 [Pirellulales bacterium]
MLCVRKELLLILAGLLSLGAAPAVRASMVHEPNNSPDKAFLLPSGQLVVNDDLNGRSGRADTILGHYDPAYGTLLDFNDNAPGVGNGFGSQLLGVPLRRNGSAYFAVTGAPDDSFGGGHSQLGKYRVSYVVRNSGGMSVKESWAEEWVTPGMVDNVWLNPDNSLPNWTGYTVDVTVNNVIGAGRGDSLDYFLFSGLSAYAPFTAQLNTEIDAIVGLYDGMNHLIATSTPVDGVQTLAGITDRFGRVKLGVTGAVDPLFAGQHTVVGPYTLVVVPEPQSGVMLAAGTALVCLFRRFRRGRRRAREHRRSG